MLDREFRRRIRPQYHSVPWSEKILDDILNKDTDNLFGMIISDILANMIAYNEIMREVGW